MKPLIWRELSRHDSAETAYWYGAQAGLGAGERFLAAVEAALAHVAEHPTSGSSRYAIPLKFEGLRFWAVPGFPYLIFYIDREAHVEVWRVLHEQRDIPAWMGSGE